MIYHRIFDAANNLVRLPQLENSEATAIHSQIARSNNNKTQHHTVNLQTKLPALMLLIKRLKIYILSLTKNKVIEFIQASVKGRL